MINLIFVYAPWWSLLTFHILNCNSIKTSNDSQHFRNSNVKSIQKAIKNLQQNAMNKEWKVKTMKMVWKFSIMMPNKNKYNRCTYLQTLRNPTFLLWWWKGKTTFMSTLWGDIYDGSRNFNHIECSLYDCFHAKDMYILLRLFIVE